MFRVVQRVVAQRVLCVKDEALALRCGLSVCFVSLSPTLQSAVCVIAFRHIMHVDHVRAIPIPAIRAISIRPIRAIRAIPCHYVPFRAITFHCVPFQPLAALFAAALQPSLCHCLSVTVVSLSRLCCFSSISVGSLGHLAVFVKRP